MKKLMSVAASFFFILSLLTSCSNPPTGTTAKISTTATAATKASTSKPVAIAGTTTVKQTSIGTTGAAIKAPAPTVISAGSFHTIGLKVVAVGSNFDHECDVGGWTGIVAIDAGISYSIGLTKDGKVVAIGQNNQHQCDVSVWSILK